MNNVTQSIDFSAIDGELSAAPDYRPLDVVLSRGEGVWVNEHTVRFAQPLVITRDQMDWALENIHNASSMN